MNNFNITSSKFYNELRNGSGFTDNLTDYTDTLVGNVGEKVQLIRTIEVFTNVLASDFGTFDYLIGTTYSSFTFGGNWNTEGLSVGSTVEISWDIYTASETVMSISGVGGNVLTTTRTNLDLQGITDGARSDFNIIVTSVSERLIYKYSLNQLSSSVNNYISPFDNNEQAYYTNAITGAYQTLTRVGNDVSWDLGSVEAKFIPSASSWVHTYEIKHTFVIPYFLDGQLSNIENLLTPTDLSGGNSLKYGCGVFLAYQSNNYNKYIEEAGYSGSVGYYNENFNGFTNDYEVQNVSISNTLNTGTIEASNLNTVTFQIKNNASNFVTGQEIIFKHSKLPLSTEYQNNSNTFDNIWLIDNLYTTIDGAMSSSTIITDCEVSLNVDNSLIDVAFDISYDATQKLLISDSGNWLLSSVIDDNTLTPNLSNRVNLKIDSQLWSYDYDISGLIQNNDIRFFPSNENIVTPTGTEYSSFTGWNGDLMGVNFSFETKAEFSAVINSAFFRLIAYKNSSDWFEISNTPINLGKIVTTLPSITTYQYQLANVDYQNSFNITPTETFNRITLASTVPVYGTSWQQWEGTLAFEVKWREWIANANVPNVFYDASETNNNKNNRTSNYSNINSYDIYGVIDLNVGSDQGANTDYRIMSDPSIELDFDVSGTNTITGTTFIYDELGNITDNLYNNQDVRIEIEFDHTLGTIGKVGGEIFIEKENSSSNVWRLSTSKNWSNPLNPLRASDTLATGNTTKVEIISALNKVTLICNTNNLNLDPNTKYFVYGRIFNT